MAPRTRVLLVAAATTKLQMSHLLAAVVCVGTVPPVHRSVFIDHVIAPAEAVGLQTMMRFVIPVVEALLKPIVVAPVPVRSVI